MLLSLLRELVLEQTILVHGKVVCAGVDRALGAEATFGGVLGPRRREARVVGGVADDALVFRVVYLALVDVGRVVVGLRWSRGLQLLHTCAVQVLVRGRGLLACLLRVVGVLVEVRGRVDILGAAEDRFLDILRVLRTERVRVGQVLAHALELPVLLHAQSFLGLERAVVLVVGSDGDVVEAAVREHAGQSACFSAVLDHGLCEVLVRLCQVLLTGLLLADHGRFHTFLDEAISCAGLLQLLALLEIAQLVVRDQ